MDAMRSGSEICRVLVQDTELAEGIPPEHRERAARDCVARTLSLPAGLWPDTPTIEQGIGLLVLRGLLIRRVGVDGRFGAELLGTGDLLRPWQGEDGPPSLSVATGWRVIEPVRLAVLDEAFAQRAARYPSLSAHLVARALKRARNLSVNMAIVQQARVDTRLHTLLWYLAARWGKVRSDGVSLPLRLTHTVLANLTAARRPTVTSALAELARNDLVHQVDDGWLLHGQPPGELFELMTVPAKLTTAATLRRETHAATGRGA
jgi:CRP/FNR family transcriptional regulator, cyclic AMP receptor protein